MSFGRRTGLGARVAQLASALSLLSIGCDPTEPLPGFLPQQGEQSEAARQFYIEQVDPQLSLCRECHVSGSGVEAPAYLAPSAEQSYESIRKSDRLFQPPGSSELLLKGEHMGPALSPGQSAAVWEWLSLEFPSGGNASGSAENNQGAFDAYVELGNCMNITDWQETGMSDFAETQTDDAGPCAGCHWNGLGGTFLNMDFALTLEKNRRLPFVGKLVQATYEDGAFVKLEPSYRLIHKGGDSCPEINQDDFDICHPSYLLTQEEENRLWAFLLKTMDRLDSEGKCTQ